MYDRLYRNSDDVELFVDLASQAGGPILEVACGTGRCVLPLIRKGFDTVGLDRSPVMLDIFRKKLAKEVDEVVHRATLLLDDGRDFAIPLRFGMAFIGMDSYCHLLTKEDQEAFADNVFQHLRPGGLLVIDVFNPDLEQLGKGAKEFEDGLVTVREEVTGVDRAWQILVMRTVVRRGEKALTSVDWSLRYSFRFEMEHLLEKIGFDIISVWGDYRRTPFGKAMGRLFVVARKPPDADMAVVNLMRTAVAEPV